MGAKIRQHVRSNVVGYMALFVALSGTAYAVDGPLPGQNQVGSQDIINAEVQDQDLAPNSVVTGKLADGHVRTADVLDNDLTGSDISDANTLGTAEVDEANLFNDNSLNGLDVQNGSLGTADIAEDTLYNDNSLTGGDVSNFGTLGTAEINEGSLFNDNSLIGADINESTLARVPDADNLDGIDSVRFVQGQSGGGEVGLGRQVQASSTERTLLRGNLGVLVSVCQSDGDAALRYVNSLLSPTVDVGDNIGAETAYTGNVATGESIFVLDAQAPNSAAVGQIQVHTSESTTGPQEAVTFLVSAQAG